MPADDERQLIFQAQQGDARSFRTLVERYMKQAYNLAYSYLSNHDEADDVVQESFVRAYRALHGFRGEAQFPTWLFRIVINVSLNHLSSRKKKDEREVRIADDQMQVSAHGDPTGTTADVREHIERALHELPSMQRAVVIMRHLNGLSTKQVSGILNCSEGTVKTHLYRGLKRMKSLLEFLGGETA